MTATVSSRGPVVLSPYVNGSVWESAACHCVMLLWVNEDWYGLLAAPAKGIEGHPVLMFHGEKNGSIFYRHRDLPVRLKGWTRVDVSRWWRGE